MLWFPWARSGPADPSPQELLRRITNIVAGSNPPLGSRVSFTPTAAWTTNITWTGFYYRVGPRAVITYQGALSGAPNAANLTLNMPTGLTIDEAALLSANLQLAGCSFCFDDTTPTQPYVSWPIYNQANNVFDCFRETGTTGVMAVITTTAPFTWAASDFFHAVVEVPVVEAP